mmetsp:Transcript_31489/g.68026  ORF Transcript_31489/g.68026 Transcript_31489/m.68026 type:complete len:242 (+) Transcript_31489:584-1309(+)
MRRARLQLGGNSVGLGGEVSRQTDHTSNALGDALFGDEGEGSCLTQVVDVGTSAELDAEGVPRLVGRVLEQIVYGSTDRHHADGVRVRLAKHSAQRLDAPRVGQAAELLVDDWLRGDELVNVVLDGLALLRGDGSGPGEVEAQLGLIDQRTPLVAGVAKDLAESEVEGVCRGVVGGDESAACVIHRQRHRVVDVDLTSRGAAEVESERTILLTIDHLKLDVAFCREDGAGVEQLASALCVE